MGWQYTHHTHILEKTSHSRRIDIKQSANLKTEWLEKKRKLATAAQPEDKKRRIYGMADTCTQLAGLNGGRIGDVARGIGGTLVSPPLNVSDVKRCFEDVKCFSQVVEPLRVVQHGVPTKPNNHYQTSR